MRRLLLLMLGIAFFSVVSAQENTAIDYDVFTIIKSGGKYNKHLDAIGYKYVRQEYDEKGNLIYLECKGKGNVACPDVFIPASRSIERFINESIIDVQSKALNNLKDGITSEEYTYKGIKFSYRDAQIIKDENGNEKLQLDINISCRSTCNPKNIDDFFIINLTEEE